MACPGNSKIAADFAGYKVGWKVTLQLDELQSEFGSPSFTRMERLVAWYIEFEVHTDVNDDTNGP